MLGIVVKLWIWEVAQVRQFLLESTSFHIPKWSKNSWMRIFMIRSLITRGLPELNSLDCDIIGVSERESSQKPNNIKDMAMNENRLSKVCCLFWGCNQYSHWGWGWFYWITFSSFSKLNICTGLKKKKIFFLLNIFYFLYLIICSQLAGTPCTLFNFLDAQAVIGVQSLLLIIII